MPGQIYLLTFNLSFRAYCVIIEARKGRYNMMRDYEIHAKAWLTKNAATLNSLWNRRNSVGVWRHTFRDSEVYVTAGMTRIVIVGNDWVVKINKPMLPRWRPFGNCRDEVRMYNKAVQDGYGWLFCRVRAMKVEHHIYYVMEKVDTVASDEGYENHIEDDFYDELGEDVIDYINDNLFDVHSDNYGFINGREEPVIFDYAANYCE